MLVAFTATRNIAEGEELTVLQWEDNGIDNSDGGNKSYGVHTRDGGIEVKGGERIPTGMSVNRADHRPLLLEKKRRYLPTAMSQYCLT